MSGRLPFSLILPGILLVWSCGGSSSPETPAAEESVEYSIPAGWIMEAPSVQMRKGQYRLPKAEGDSEDAVLAVYHFPGQGGSIQSNIDRWVNQFKKPDGSPVADAARIEKMEVNGRTVTIVDVSGTYSASMGPMAGGAAEKPGYRMLGAIIDTNSGPWFFKLTGPENTISRWEASFTEFVNSLKVG